MGRIRRKPVAKAPPGDGVWQVPTRFNFTRDVVEALAADALRPALTFVDHKGIIERPTFREIAADANRWTALLRSRGLVPGDRLLVFVGMTPAWHAILLGALKAGLVTVPCPEMLSAADLAFRAEHSGARLVVADRERAPELAQLDADVGVVLIEEVAGELREQSVDQPTHDTAADDAAFILYTSGTTNDPRGAVHTHGYTWAQRLQAASWLDARPGDLVWCTAPAGTAKSIWNVLIGPWSCGAELAIHEGGFEAEQRFELIERLGVTLLCQGPAEYRRMAKHPSLEEFYIGSVRRAVSAGEPLDPSVATIFHDAFGLTIHDGYGQTENTVLVANLPGTAFRPGSMGLPTPGHEVAVIDDEGNEQPVGKEGDIALKGRPPSLFREYWNAPDETRAAFRGQWYITGDRATRDEDGHLWFSGRVGDAILSAAHRINPFEVESALLEHPSVTECAVVGRPVAGRGNLVKAFVILRAGVDPSDELVVALQDHVEAVAAPYKVPREIEFVTDLPRTAAGKIRRVELREPDSAGRAGTPDAVAVLTETPAAARAEETEARRKKAAEDAALEEARRKKKARAAEAAEAAAVEAAARAERRADLERRTAAALAAEQASREEEARQADAVEQARLAAEQARAAEEQLQRANAERAAEATARAAPKDEPDPESGQGTTAPTKASTEPSPPTARSETERPRKDEEQRLKEKKKEKEKEKAAAEQRKRDEADARRAAAAKAKDDERQRKEDEKRRRDEEKAAAEKARRDEAEAERAAAARAKEDRDAAAAEQRAAKEASRQEAKSRSSAPPTIPESDNEDDESRPNPALLARLSEYGHGKGTEGSDTPAE